MIDYAPPPAIIQPFVRTKHASFVPGMFPAGIAAVAPLAPPPSVTYIGRAEDTANASSYSFASQSIGAEDATRRVVVVVNWTAEVTLSSATIAGVSATIHLQVNALDAGANTAIISALVPTGTTGTIAFTLSGSGSLRGHIAVFRAINETSASPHATANDNDPTPGVGTMTTTIDIPSGGWVVAGACCITVAAGSSNTWVGATEDYDAAAGDNANFNYGGAHQSGLSSETGRTISCTNNGTDPEGAMAVISWG